MGNSVEQAAKIIADLEGKRDGLHARARDLAELQQTLSFDAHVGNQSAAKKLDAAIAEAMMLDQKIVNVEIALDEARNRLEDAQADAAAAADREQAQAVRDEAQVFSVALAQCGAAMASFVAGSNAARDSIVRLNQLGQHWPSLEQYRVLGAAAAVTGLLQTPWAREFPVLSPRERHTYPALDRTWQLMIAKAVAERLGETKQPTNEAA